MSVTELKYVEKIGDFYFTIFCSQGTIIPLIVFTLLKYFASLTCLNLGTS